MTLDPSTITSINPDEVHEWRIAIYDLVEDNKFHPARVKAKGPYALHLSIVGNSIVLDVRNPDTYEPIAAHYLSLTPFRRSIRDYFRIRDSYYEAIKTASTDADRNRRHGAPRPPQRGRRAAAHPARQQARDGPQHRAPAVHPDLRGAALCEPHRRAREQAADGALRLLDELGALADRRGARAQAVPRPRHRPLGRRPLRQGRRLRPRGDGGDRRRYVGPHARTPWTSWPPPISTSSLPFRPMRPRRWTAAASTWAPSEHWPMLDPTTVEGNREAVLSAYRTLRDTLQKRVRERLEPLVAGGSQAK